MGTTLNVQEKRVFDYLKEQIRVMKRRKTSFFALSFGNQPEMEYLNLCDRYWEM